MKSAYLVLTFAVIIGFAGSSTGISFAQEAGWKTATTSYDITFAYPGDWIKINKGNEPFGGAQYEVQTLNPPGEKNFGVIVLTNSLSHARFQELKLYSFFSYGRTLYEEWLKKHYKEKAVLYTWAARSSARPGGSYMSGYRAVVESAEGIKSSVIVGDYNGLYGDVWKYGGWVVFIIVYADLPEKDQDRTKAYYDQALKIIASLRFPEK
jgi:hypothetical protein